MRDLKKMQKKIVAFLLAFTLTASSAGYHVTMIAAETETNAAGTEAQEAAASETQAQTAVPAPA